MSNLKLTPDQTKAVEHGDGPLLIVAGAGTGKTRVITHRIAHLIEKKGISPKNILAVTFTNNAANEMSERLSAMITQSFDELSIGTFHAICAEIVRAHALDYGISPFYKIATAGEQMLILAKEFDSLNLKYHPVKGRPYGLIKTFLSTISQAKNEMITGAEIKKSAEKARSSLKRKTDLSEKELKKADELIGKHEELAVVYEKYNSLLMNKDSFDFDDLIMHTINLFKEKPHILEDYRDKWRYIMVDEFQDTNHAQSELIDMLAGTTKNICVVGDDDQSIYKFRGASVSNIVNFRERYPDATEVYLEDNYRSTEEILECSYSVVSKNIERLDKKLKTATGKKDAGSVALIETASRQAEADFIVQDILEHLSSSGTSLDDFAVLAARNGDLKPVVRALTNAGIPYNIASGSGFFQKSEIKDLLAWIRALNNPLDSESIIRIIETEPFKIDPIDVSRINVFCKKRKIELSEGLKKVETIEGLTDLTKARVRSWQAAFDDLLRLRNKMAADAMLRQIIDRIGYRERLMIEESLDSLQRLSNISALEEVARTFSDETFDNTIRYFTDYLKILVAGSIDDFSKMVQTQRSVNLMTVHKAKGLEFEIVYLVGVTDSAFPGRRRTAPNIPEKLLKSPPSSKEANVEESRRIFYVACTRAKSRLNISYPKISDETMSEIKRSRFLDELILDRDLEIHKVSDADISQNSALIELSRSLKAVENDGSSLPLINSLTDGGELTGQLVNDLKIFFNRQKISAILATKRPAESVEMIDSAIDKLFSSSYQQELKNEEFSKLLISNDQEELTILKQRLGQFDNALFMPFNEDGGLTLSVSDIIQYNNCPFAFKAKKIYQIPSILGIEADFGILIHNILQRFHEKYERDDAKLSNLTDLFEMGLKSKKMGRTTAEKQLISKARDILEPYFNDFKSSTREPTFLEREFHLHLKPHWIIGRVDRVDKAEDGYELIDYKTSKAWNPKKVKDDLQLDIYGLAASTAWEIEPTSLSYYFLLDNKKMHKVPTADSLKAAEKIVLETIDDIMQERFDPKTDFMKCGSCDYSLICKAKEH